MKSFRPLKVLAVVFLGMFLFLTQVDTSLAATTKPNVGEKSEYYAPKDAGAINDYEGGMNNFSDRDARAQGSVRGQAEALKRQAEQNIKKSSSDLGRNARRVAKDSDKIGENIQRKADSVTDKLQQEAESLGKSANRGLRNIKDNAQEAPDYAADQAEKTVGNPIEAIKRGSQDVGNAAQRTVNDAR
ncbi:MAG: hypothetical protein IGS39_12645 [Calothrix sp. C42_A2020_038]|nr:hypothetical protein [Calothrix sp. C42_A2020_038]